LTPYFRESVGIIDEGTYTPHIPSSIIKDSFRESVRIINEGVGYFYDKSNGKSIGEDYFSVAERVDN